MIRASNIPDEGDDDSVSSSDVGLVPTPAEPSLPPQRKPRGIPATPAAQAEELSYLNPAQVAAMWGISHDKVLKFIKAGELDAFNVASTGSARPQFKIPITAVKAFEQRRSGRDPSRSKPPSAPRSRSSRSDLPAGQKYF